MMRAEPLPEREAQHLSGFEEFRVDLSDRRERIEVQRETHPERHQQHLGQFADTEPQDEQRNEPRCGRARIICIGGSTRGLEPPGEPDGGPQRDARIRRAADPRAHGSPTPPARRPADRSRSARCRRRRSTTARAGRLAEMRPECAAELPQREQRDRRREPYQRPLALPPTVIHGGDGRKWAQPASAGLVTVRRRYAPRCRAPRF